ncbi:MAG: asparaginase domain-containing protein [Pseudomonadota bacterium]
MRAVPRPAVKTAGEFSIDTAMAMRVKATRDTEAAMDILVINTGGTISSFGHPLAPMSAEAFASAAERHLSKAVAARFPDLILTYATELRFPTSANGLLDSTNLQPADWCRIAAFLLEHYAAYDGFIVLHGTDTMAHTASALPFLLNVFDAEGFGAAMLSKPVVLTGSQVPMFAHTEKGEAGEVALQFNTDAFQNYCAALAAMRLGLTEVCVAFGGKLLRGPRAMKTDTKRFEAFSSPNTPALAEFGTATTLHEAEIRPGPFRSDLSLDNPSARQVALAHCHAIAGRIDQCLVMPFTVFPAAFDQAAGSAVLADMIQACLDRELKGLVLLAFGAGNLPSGDPDDPTQGAVYRVLKAASDTGLVVVDATQVHAGQVALASYAAGAWLPQVGALSAGDMTAVCAVTKLTLLLASAPDRGWDARTVKALFQRSLCGEMRSLGCLDGRINPVLLPSHSLATADGSAALENDPISGLRLVDGHGAVLWTPEVPPGRLVIRQDGRLTLLGSSDAALWSVGGARESGQATALLLDGSAADGSLRLRLYDYAARETTAVLFDQSQAA